MKVLFIFLDGVGLGDPDPLHNPFMTAQTPTLLSLSNGHLWLRDTPRMDTGRALFIPTDARLGVPGRPQSATNQAAILTGLNVPALIGEHYGPKPTDPIRAILAQPENIFKRTKALGKSVLMLEAYPPRLFAGIARGKILRSSIQQAAFIAEVALPGEDEIRRGTALTVDWTGEGWRTGLGYTDTPVYTPFEAGALMASLAMGTDFAFFSHWITDEIGHRGPLERGVAILELFDQVLAGTLATWDDSQGVIVITSDHGNLENLAIRQHTENDVPTVVIGAARHAFDQVHALTDLAPAILDVLSRES